MPNTNEAAPPIRTGICVLDAADTCVGTCDLVLTHPADALRSGARAAFVSARPRPHLLGPASGSASMNLNADIGEGASEDEAILACIDSANVACGVHAGSAMISIATALRCKALGIEVGAHPGYDDKAGFGRIERSMSAREIEALIAFQVAALAAVAPLAYVKPHGALYHRCQRDAEVADALARVAKAHGVGVVGQPGFGIIAAAQRAGIPSYREGFADRLMLPDGTLAPRSEPGAMLSPHMAADQALRLAQSGRVDTICIHGDTKGAGQVAAAVRQALRDAGIQTKPLAS